MLLELIGAGFVVGILVGATGVGGASLMAPLLVMFFKVDPLIVVGTDLLYNAPTKIVGAFVHARQGTLNLRLALDLTAGGAIGLAAGWFMLRYFESRYNLGDFTSIVRHWIGMAVCLAAVLTILPSLFGTQVVPEDSKPPSRLLLMGIGGLVGVIVMATSVGAGAITLPLLLLLRRYDVRSIVGSDLAFSAMITAVASAAHVGLGNVNLAISMSLLLGSIPGVLIGSRFSSTSADRILRPTVGAVLLFAGLRML
ncbi:MAG: sulfite exporter TauE/SafE family protein [Candidatus Eremiobacteraeota bacterium]|nr:sulfite exporter TauE/SafE family protein [Candidatus Eremiobacteraeota bacterium]